MERLSNLARGERVAEEDADLQRRALVEVLITTTASARRGAGRAALGLRPRPAGLLRARAAIAS